MNPPRVSAVVLTYNGWHLLSSCLSTVLAQDWPDLEILVVDNGSQENIAGEVTKHFPRVPVLVLPHNLGFAGANNEGVRHTSGDYVALLSNDVRLPPDFIRRLVENLEATPLAAVAGPAVYNLNMDMARYPGNGSMSLTGTVIHNVFRDLRLTFGAAGCALVFKRELVGLPFDDDYQFFHEEIYLAWRARLRGYTVLREPGVVVEHVGGATVGSLSDENRFLLERNRCLNFLLFFSNSVRLRVWPLLLLARLLERLSDWRQGRAFTPVRRARRWLKEHRLIWLAKRRALQSERRVPDKDIVRWMSCKITNHSGWAGALFNRLAYIWCLSAGLKTWEMVKPTKDR
ncbi:glycosyltransferase family 2 protein [candidate division FCPU426 bacterium]|nr:glycosyltransferase family 2 protein [candidate division FCPU426 bacterium]